jgi:hypothetical protein
MYEFLQTPHSTYQRKDWGSILNRIICDDVVAAICRLQHAVLQVRERSVARKRRPLDEMRFTGLEWKLQSSDTREATQQPAMPAYPGERTS